MIRRLAFVTIFVLLPFSSGVADDTKQNTASEELRQLDAFLGKWQT